MTIPVKNLYFMLCYAWNRLDEAEIVKAGVEDSTELSDLFARVLINGVKHCLKDGLDRGYRETDETSACLRGRIDLDYSLSRLLLQQGQARCRVDELTFNILPNQIIKTTLWRLSRVEGLDKDLRKEVVVLDRRMAAVDRIALARQDFNRVQLYSNNRFYRFLIKVCQVINDAVLIEKGDGEYLFRDFVQDERAMRQVFQDFVFNFYRLHQSKYSVGRDRFGWDVDEPTEEVKALMPMMETDITLRSADHAVIIDTKFSKSALQSRYTKETLRSEHLYQLFAYLKNLEGREPRFKESSGILLYPTTGPEIDFSTTVQGHLIRVATVDMSRDAKAIQAALLSILLRMTP